MADQQENCWDPFSGSSSQKVQQKKNQSRQGATRSQARKILNLEKKILGLTTRTGVAKKTTRTRATPRVNFGSSSLSALHPSAQKFFLALTHPHSESARGAHYPDQDARPSLKFTANSRKTFAVPPNSALICFVNPSISSDRPSLFFVSGSLADLAGAPYTTAAIPAGVTYQRLNVPYAYSSAGLDSGRIAARVVSLGLRVRYTGSVLNRGGSALWLNDVNGGEQILTLTEAVGAALATKIEDWTSYPQSRICSFNRNDQHEFTLAASGPQYWQDSGPGVPDAINPLSGAPFSTPFGLNTTETFAGPPAVLVLRNNTGTQAIEFTIDIVGHIEYSGGTVMPLQTPSAVAHEDTIKVRNAYSSAQQTHAATPDKHPAPHTESVLSTIMESGKSLGSFLAKKAISEVSKPDNAERIALGMSSMFL